MPMTLLATMSRPNSPLINEPVTSTMAKHTQDRVDPGEYIGPNDMRDAAGGTFGSLVDSPVGNPLCHFRIGQAANSHRVKVPSLSES
jgi:hypothetical protein